MPAPVPATWEYREDGQVTSIAHNVTDPAPLHRHNAYAKTWRAEELTAPEDEALSATDETLPFTQLHGDVIGDASLGLIAHHRRRIFEAIDELACEIEAMGAPRVAAWEILQDYVQRGTAAVCQQAGGAPHDGGEHEAAFEPGRWVEVRT